MDSKKQKTRITLLIFFIFIVNYLAGQFYWYSAIWYFDMLMHFLGGFWLGLVFIWLFSRHFELARQFDVSFRFFSKIILLVFLFGALWELFEVFFYNYIAQNSFNLLDTISDICFDGAGGIFAIFYYFKKTRPTAENAI